MVEALIIPVQREPMLFLYHNVAVLDITLALQIFFHAFKTDVGRCTEDKNAQELLYILTKLFRLSEDKQDGFHEDPKYKNGNQEDP